MLVEHGETVMLGVVCAPGDHTYNPPPEEGVAVSVAEPPSQIVASGTKTVGIAVTFTACTTGVLVQPFKVYSTV